MRLRALLRCRLILYERVIALLYLEVSHSGAVLDPELGRQCLPDAVHICILVRQGRKVSIHYGG